MILFLLTSHSSRNHTSENNGCTLQTSEIGVILYFDHAKCEERMENAH